MSVGNRFTISVKTFEVVFAVRSRPINIIGFIASGVTTTVNDEFGRM
jgi:hypothetical protein